MGSAALLVPIAAPALRKPWSRVLVPLLCLGLILTVAFSPGFLEADEIGHFVMSRDAFHEPRYCVDIWGRPACTILYAIGAPAGITGSRLISAMVTLLVCWGTALLAARVLPQSETPSFFERHRTAWIWMLLFAQPFFLLNSATVMTEMLLALFWVWGAVFVTQKRMLLASLFIGLGGLARPEGFFAIAAWPAFLWLLNELGLVRVGWRKILLATFLAGLPVLLWFIAGVLIMHSWMWVRDDWPWSVKSQYGASLSRFFFSLFIAAHGLWLPVVVAVPSLVSALLLRRRFGLAAVLLVLPVVCFVLLHGVLGGLGLFGSLAMPRYFICIAPLIAILAYWGCQLMTRWVSVRVLGAVLLPAGCFLGLEMALGWRFGPDAMLRFLYWAVPLLAALGFVICWKAEQCFSEKLMAALTVVLVAVPLVTVVARKNLPIPEPDDAKYIDAAAKALPALMPHEQWAERLVAFHPYVRYAMDVPPDVNYRSVRPGYMENAPLGTVVLSDSGLWESEGGPQDEDFLAWGYELDEDIQAHIDAAIPGADQANPWHVQVHIWVKTHEASTPAGPAR